MAGQDTIAHLRQLADWQGADFKWAILAELGRLSRVADFDLVLEAADAVCQSKLSVKACAAVIRRIRLGRAARGDGRTLLRVLAACVEEYSRTHPEVGHDQILTAVAALHALLDHADDIQQRAAE